MNHDKDCAWEKADCEYKATHHYCPHPEHACTCTPATDADGALITAIREFIWAGMCWNDHNFREGDLASKCRTACNELGIKTVDDANKAMVRIANALRAADEDSP